MTNPFPRTSYFTKLAALIAEERRIRRTSHATREEQIAAELRLGQIRNERFSLAITQA